MSNSSLKGNILKLKTVRIGMHTVKIVWAKHDDIRGEYDSDDAIIRMDRDLAGARLGHTLWHEIKHVLWDIYSIGSLPNEEDGDVKQHLSEEEIVSRESMAECIFMHDNPGVMKLIQGALLSDREESKP